MSRKTNMLLSAICVFAIVLNFNLPFIQQDLYTTQSIFHILIDQRPQLLTSGAILHGKYYPSLFGTSLSYLILQITIVTVKRSKVIAALSAFIGTLGLIVIVITCLNMRNNGAERNFVFLSGFYVLLLILTTKNIVDWLYLRSCILQFHHKKDNLETKSTDKILPS